MDLKDKITRHFEKLGKFYPYQEVKVDFGEHILDGVVVRDNIKSFLVDVKTAFGNKQINVNSDMIYAEGEEQVSEEDEKQYRKIFEHLTSMEEKIREIDKLTDEYKQALLNQFDIPGYLEDKKILDKIAMDAIEKSNKWKTYINNWYTYITKIGPGAKSTSYAGIVKGMSQWLLSLSKEVNSLTPDIVKFLTEVIEKLNKLKEEHTKQEKPGREKQLELRYKTELPDEVKQLILKQTGKPLEQHEPLEEPKTEEATEVTSAKNIWDVIVNWVSKFFTPKLKEIDKVFETINKMFVKMETKFEAKAMGRDETDFEVLYNHADGNKKYLIKYMHNTGVYSVSVYENDNPIGAHTTNTLNDAVNWLRETYNVDASSAREKSEVSALLKLEADTTINIHTLTVTDGSTVKFREFPEAAEGTAWSVQREMDTSKSDKKMLKSLDKEDKKDGKEYKAEEKADVKEMQLENKAEGNPCIDPGTLESEIKPPSQQAVHQMYTEKTKIEQVQEQEDQSLLSIVKDMIKNGISEIDIADELAEQGVPHEEIAKILSECKTTNPKLSTSKYLQQDEKTNFTVGKDESVEEIEEEIAEETGEKKEKIEYQLGDLVKVKHGKDEIIGVYVAPQHSKPADIDEIIFFKDAPIDDCHIIEIPPTEIEPMGEKADDELLELAEEAYEEYLEEMEEYEEKFEEKIEKKVDEKEQEKEAKEEKQEEKQDEEEKEVESELDAIAWSPQLNLLPGTKIITNADIQRTIDNKTETAPRETSGYLVKIDKDEPDKLMYEIKLDGYEGTWITSPFKVNLVEIESSAFMNKQASEKYDISSMSVDRIHDALDRNLDSGDWILEHGINGILGQLAADFCIQTKDVKADDELSDLISPAELIELSTSAKQNADKIGEALKQHNIDRGVGERGESDDMDIKLANEIVMKLKNINPASITFDDLRWMEI